MKIFVTNSSALPSTKEKNLSSGKHFQFSSMSWYRKYPMCYGIFTISVIQIVFYITATPSSSKLLRFEPNKEREVWRFLTYMFLHTSWCHLALNVIVQLLFAIQLEKHQGHLRVLLLYLIGGITGALGAACVSPDVVVGASAGAYALLLSHISHILLNYENTKRKVLSCSAVGFILLSDVFYGIGHIHFGQYPIISWGAHIGGILTGLFLGMAIFRSYDVSVNRRVYIRTLFWLGIVMYVMCLLIIFIIHYKIKKCTPQHLSRDKKYVYHC